MQPPSVQSQLHRLPPLGDHGPFFELSPCGAAGTGRLDVELLDAQPKRLCELSHPQGWEQDGHAGLQG